jgi:hypothetical protein
MCDCGAESFPSCARAACIVSSCRARDESFSSCNADVGGFITVAIALIDVELVNSIKSILKLVT